MSKLLHQLNHGPLDAGLALLPAKLDSIKARALILKIVLQESLGIHRRQLGNGPARGLAQFELGGACTGVLTHRLTKPHAQRILGLMGIPATPRAMWKALEYNDTLAMAMARLNLLWLPAALPGLDDEQEGHEQYLEAWRPGAWDRGSPAQRAALRAKWGRFHTEVNTYLRTGD